MKRPFRPSARLLGTIGQDIIKDMHAAVVELVKNAYDADAKNVVITFESTRDNKLNLSVHDDGHGMDEDTVINKWLVPSTDDKLSRRTSPQGRLLQGRKGIGRFAAAILGETLTLQTFSKNKCTSLFIDWREFNESRYLDEILVEVSTNESKHEKGTLFFIEGSTEKLELWNDKEIEYLIKELRKLLTPMDNANVKEKDEFIIALEFKNFCSQKYRNERFEIMPLPLLDYYDYRLFGRIYSDGRNDLVYQNKGSGVEERCPDFKFSLTEKSKFEGEIYIDFRIFDRDPESIENLVNEMVISGEGRIGKNEAKNLLNDIAGISIFRNKFRIRPYGDEGYDWLSLDKKRVQIPALRIGANQISGVIEIQDEEISKLVEKSARDGLKEDAYYHGLVSVINQLLNFVETKRYIYRQKTGKGRKNQPLSKQISALADFSAMKSKMNLVMCKAQLDEQVVQEVNDFIDNQIQEKIKIATDLEKQIAIYQGQATLGKIMDVLMHEVRKPLQWIKNQAANIKSAFNRYDKSKDQEDLAKIVRLSEEMPLQLDSISTMFKRLDSLATRKRSSMRKFKLNDAIYTAIEIFANEIEENDIDLKFDIQEDYYFNGWREDILSALANIVENAVYWVTFAKDKRIIEVSVIEDKEMIQISIWNNGPEIPEDLIEDGLLFIPGISAKNTDSGSGTGLGLPIAGEAVERNGGQVRVIKVSKGAKFLITLPIQGEDNEQ